jgi:hypothetical protein
LSTPLLVQAGTRRMTIGSRNARMGVAKKKGGPRKTLRTGTLQK